MREQTVGFENVAAFSGERRNLLDHHAVDKGAQLFERRCETFFFLFDVPREELSRRNDRVVHVDRAHGETVAEGASDQLDRSVRANGNIRQFF